MQSNFVPAYYYCSLVEVDGDSCFSDSKKERICIHMRDVSHAVSFGLYSVVLYLEYTNYYYPNYLLCGMCIST
jgi:hypothetical protein